MSKHKFRLDIDTRLSERGHFLISGVMACEKCDKKWAVFTKVPLGAIKVLQPNCSRERRDEFINVFIKMIESDAKDFIDFHSDIENEDAMECEVT